jgi:hypothetical protein
VPANAKLIASRQLYTSRVWPRATAGSLLAYQYDPANGSFYMSATDPVAVRVGTKSKETTIYLPANVKGAVTVGGSAKLDTTTRAPDGSRLAFFAPTGGPSGAYSITVGTPSSSMKSTVEAAAASPLPPISEPDARQVVAATIAAAPSSSNAKVRSNASEVSLLESLLLGTTDPNG